jgi:nucleotide-binding universal stress UspA family protein
VLDLGSLDLEVTMSLRILVALDASSRAPHVLDAAVSLAKRLSGKLIVARIVTVPIEVPIEAFSMTPASLEQRLVEDATRALSGSVSGVDAALIEKQLVVCDSPWRGICELAKTEDVDLIMLGSHGYSGIDRLLGTTAAKVVNHADRSVLVVRHEERLLR